MPAFLRRFCDGFALAALALICAAVFWPILRGQTFYYGDLQLYFHPLAAFWKGELARGRVPLWNAGILGGTPFVGNPQMGVLYPPALLLLLFPASQALSILSVLHFWLGGALFYGWMRRGVWQLGALAALLGACVWMLCGFVVSKSQFPNMLMAVAWVPAVLWAGEALAARPAPRRALVLGAALALQLLAAHAQISLLSGYMLLVVIFYRWRLAPARSSGWRVAANLAGAIVWAGLLSLGQTLPVVEALGATARQHLTLSQASRFVLVPRALVTLVWPHFYGDPMRGSWNYPRGANNWGNQNEWESACYLGIVPLILASVALWRDRRARFWGAWTGLFLWLSMGVSGWLYVAAFHGLPGVARFHDAGRFLLGFSLGGALLAALGAQWMAHNLRRGARWTALALLLTLLDVGVYARGFYPTMPVELAQTPPARLWGADSFLDARQGRLWAPGYANLWEMFQPVSDFRPGDWNNSRRFFAIAPPNRHLLRGWLAEVGYEPLFDRATRQRIGALDFRLRDDRFAPALAPQLGRSSVRFLQLARARPLPATPDWTLVYASPWTMKTPTGDQRVFVYRNERCLPRARWKVRGQSWQRARIVAESARSIELEAPARATQIELADAMRPGWRAFLNQTPLAIETTTEGWRRLNLPVARDDKARRVRFEYAPQPWKLGVWVSLCALGFWCASWTATRGRR